MMDQFKALNVAIVGSGPGCKAIMDMILAEKLSQLQMKLIGVAYRNPESVGYRFAKKSGIYVTRDYRDFYKLKDLNMIIELTGHEQVANEISGTKPDYVRVIDHVAARVLWDVFQIEEQRTADYKRVHDELRNNELEKEAILDSILEVVLYQDLEHRVLWGNRMASGAVCLTPEEFVGRYCYEAWQQRSNPCPGCPVVKTRETGQTQEAEITTPDGRVWFVRGYPVRDANGDIVGVVEVKLEITDRKRAEEALRESEAKFRSLVEITSDWIWEVDKSGTYTYASPKVKDLLGYEPEEIIGKTPFDLMPADEAKRMSEWFRNILESREPFAGLENTNLHKDGRHVMLDTSGVPFFDKSGHLVGYRGIDRDISNRKRAEQALRESEEFNSTLLTNSSNPILVINPDSSLRYVNPSLENLTGFSSSELIGRKAPYPWWTEETLQKTSGDLEKAMAKGARGLEELFQKKNGERFWVEITSSPIRQNGKFKYYMANWIDVTKRKRAEAALRKSEARLQLTLETIPSGLFTVDLDRKITYWNKEAEVITGLKAGEAIGKDCLEAFDCEECKKGCGLLNDAVEKPLYEKECTIHVGGRDIAISKNADILKDSKGVTIGGLESFIDITERKQAEEALRESMHRMHIAYDQSLTYAKELKEEITERKQAEKKLLIYHEKLRSLASKLSLAEERQRRRVAIEVHDSISQNLAFVKMKLGARRALTSSSNLGGTMGEILDLVDETIQNTRALISELGSPILYELGFVPAVEWLTQQAQNQHGIVLDFEDDEQPKPLSKDVRVLLFQAARELLVNIAKHAQARTAKVSITREGDQVRVDVEDDGVGFDNAEIGSSMDTTGRFGLFSIRVRLEPLGGHMEVESKPGHGTRVTLIAPLKHNEGNKKEKVS